MPSDEEVSQQLELLFIHRRNLAQYLMQQAQLGTAYVSPNISNGIAETRQNIRRVKSILRNWGRNVEDHPDDDSLSDSVQYDQSNVQQLRSSLSVDKSIEHFDAEEATLIGDLTASAMGELHYQPLTVNDFKLAYHEMISNAVEHGCTNADDVFHVKVNVTTQFATATILNPTGRKFDVRSILESQRQHLMENPRLRRGRGLLRITELADTFAEAKNKEGIKAVFYKDRVTLDIQSKDDISIIKGRTAHKVWEKAGGLNRHRCCYLASKHSNCILLGRCDQQTLWTKNRLFSRIHPKRTSLSLLWQRAAFICEIL